MIQTKDVLSFEKFPRSVNVFFVFLILTHKDVYGGVSQQTGPPQSVTVMVGDDVVLPCQLDPPTDAVSKTVEWGRPDLDPSFVYVWHEGKELLVDQNEAYQGRASFSIDKLKRGDLSLKLSNVKISDSGTYRCYIPKLSEEYFVALLVGAVSSTVVRLAGTDGAFSGRVVLQCESGGWHPKPEVLWLDGEGKLLSAGPPETVRGPDDLYTVSSRVTVEKRHSNSFTCRVQQKDINQTREAHINVPDDFFMTQSGCTPSITFSVLFGFMFISAVVFLVWKQRQYKMDVRGNELKKEDDLQNGLKEDLQRNDEEQNEMTNVIETLEEVIKEMKNQKEKLNSQMQETEKQAKENEEKANSVEKEVTEMAGDKTENKAKGYRKLKEILIEVNKNLVEGKNAFQQLGLSTDKLIQRTNGDMKRITERKKKVEKNFEQIRKQLDEMEREREKGQMERQSEKGGRIQDNKMEQIL